MISLIEKSKAVIRKNRQWLLAVVLGFLLLMLEEADIEPLFSVMAFLYWSLIIYWVAKWLFGQIKSTIKQKKEKTNIELLHLQSQVNPHFFFNTLNNLYGLIDKDQKKAKEMVLKLSDMMRYSIYDGQKERVTLEEELHYLQNYIDLHKARYHKAIDIRFEHHFQQAGTKVMPLLFIMLLENAFKHGVENLREDAYISINLISAENEIIFTIENNFEPNEIHEKEGIGLKNLTRRLELAYPKKHTLAYSAVNNIFKAQLILKLA